MSGGQFNIPMVFRGPGGQRCKSARSTASRSRRTTPVPPQSRDAVDGVRREGPAQDVDSRRQPGRVHRGRDALQHDVGSAGRGRSPDPIGLADVKREGKDVTLIAWSKMVWTCLEAAKTLAEEGIECEVVDPRTLRPLDVDTLATSVKQDRPLRDRRGRLARGRLRRRGRVPDAEALHGLTRRADRARDERRRADAVREEPRRRGPAAGQGRGRRGHARVLYLE